MFPNTSAEAVMKQLEPFHGQLREIFSKAVAKFNRIEPALLLPLMRWNRSRATCIWAYVMEELELAFPPESGVTLQTKYETIEIHFGPNLVARLKKMNPSGFTSNYPTGRIKAFHDGNQGELFVLHWAKPSRVDIGYVLNETATGVDQILVARRKSLKLLDWFYPIMAPDNGAPIPLEGRPLPGDGNARVAERRDADASNQRKDADNTGP